MMPIRIYISCNQLPRTAQSLNYLLHKLSNSDLRDHKIILVHSNNWDANFEDCGLDIELYNTGLNEQYYEFPALSKVKADSELQEFYGLYMHCKGSSKTDTTEWHNCEAWIDYMCYGLIDHAQQCLYHLNAGADLVGSQWHWHFKGNFYWFRSSYVKQLVEPMIMDLDYRFNCEFWCAYSCWWGRYPLPRVKNLYYLAGLETDSDFLKLKQQNYMPNLNKKHVKAGAFADFYNLGKAEVFDIICVTQQDFDQYHTFFDRYLNYDGVVINTDTGQVYEANYFLH